MTEIDVRIQILNSFLSTPHGKLADLAPLHLRALEGDPLFYGHLAAWYAGRGEVRDHKVLFVAHLLTSEFPELREAGWVLLQKLPPHMVAAALDHAKRAIGKTPRVLKSAVTSYLRTLEASTERFDRAALRGKHDIKHLYASLRIAPASRAQAILFDEQPPEGSPLCALKALAQATDPAEQARVIVAERIPYTVAAGAVRTMTPSVLVALIDVMTPQETINHLASLKKRGAFDSPEVKALIEAKLKAAETDTRVSTLKATRALAHVALDESTEALLTEVTDKRVANIAHIARPTALFVDKCVVGDTLVPTAQGLISIRQLVPPIVGSVREVVLSLSVATRHACAEAVRVFVNGVKPVCYITTAKGYRLGASLNHPVLAYDPSTATLHWRLVGDLCEGDYVALRRNTQCFGEDFSLRHCVIRTPYQPTESRFTFPDTLTPKFARWLGYVVAEGDIQQRPARIAFTNADEEQIADFRELTAELFGLQAREEPHKGSHRLVVASSSFLTFLEQEIGLRKTRARDCVVPAAVLMSSAATQREFLRAYFAGDGGAVYRRRAMLAATSASEKLLRTIQLMLLNFGVVSAIKPFTTHATNGAQLDRCYWRLVIGGADAARYMERIGFASTAKTRVCEAALASRTLTWAARWDAVPALATAVYAYLGHGTQHQLRRLFPTLACFRGNAKEDRVPADLLPELLKQFPRFGEVGDVAEIIESTLYLDSIRSIERGEEPVYDLCVPSEQSFISNGIVSHNSSSMTQAIDVAKEVAALISAVCESFRVLAFDTEVFEVQAAGAERSAWERAFRMVRPNGSTSIGAPLAKLARERHYVEQLVIITDMGENSAPLFHDAYAQYVRELGVGPQVTIVGVGGRDERFLGQLREHGIPHTIWEFGGDYYSLPNILNLLNAPSRAELVEQVMAVPLPARGA